MQVIIGWITDKYIFCNGHFQFEVCAHVQVEIGIHFKINIVAL